MMKNRNLLLVDLSNQAYKAAASHPHLTTDGGDVFTGGLYGFICAVAKAISVTGATAICLCEDRKPYIRSHTYPEYKALRKTNKDPVLVEKVITTVQQVRELCKVTGWPIWSIQGFESDDLIAHTTIFNRHRFKKIIAMSNDSDLCQLFTYKCFEMYKGKKGIYDATDFDAEWGLPAHEFYLALALTGTHNEVEGIKGIGPATAKKILKSPNGWTKMLAAHPNLIERNINLIKLPHKEFPRSEQLPKKGEYNERELVRFCGKYGIKLERWMSENFENIGGAT